MHAQSTAAKQPGIKPPAAKTAAAEPATTPPGKTGTNNDAQLIADFKARVDKYVELRKKADNSAPPLKESKDAGKIKEAQQSLLERVAAARSTAKQGEIF